MADPDLDRRQFILAFGAILNSALYLIFLFVAGLVTAHPMAWGAAIIDAGMIYVSYTLQAVAPEERTTNFVAVMLTIALGLVGLAGLFF